MTTDPTMALASYVHQMSYDDLPQTAIANAKLALLDTIGVMFAGSEHKVGRMIADYVRASGATGPASILATEIRTAPEFAALANGILAHALDYDDHGHASTLSLPAALALGEARNASGKQLLLAYIIGREVCFQLTRCLDSGGWEGSGPQGRGWHSVGITGAMGATAAAAKMLDLDPPTICTALGITVSLTGGVFANRGTMTKPLHAGNAARSAVLASTLASKGFTADETILTSSGGFADVYGVPQGVAAAAVDRLRQHLHIVEHGIGVKRYPSCSPTHGYINAMRLLKEKHRLTPEQVESIACSPSRSLRCLYPKTDLEAKFSAAFSLVATLIDGEVNLRNCTEAFLRRADVQALLAKTVYLEQASGPERLLRVKTVHGEVYEQALIRPKDITDPDEIRRKYYDSTNSATGEARARRIEAAVDDLEKLDDIGRLTDLLRS